MSWPAETQRQIDIVLRARAIAAKGYNLSEAARLLGITPQRLGRLRQTHAEHWRLAPDLRLAEDIPPRGKLPREPRVIVVQSPPKPERQKVNPLVEEAIHRVNALLAAGRTMDQAAAAVGRGREALKTWQRKHPDLWSAARDIAMATTVAILREHPERAAADPKERALQLRKLEAWCEVRGQTLLPSGEETLMGFFDQVYRPRRLLGASFRTAEHYRVTVRFFSRYLGRAATVADLTDEQVAGFLESRTAAVAATTVNGYRTDLLCLWRLARKCKLIEPEPAIAKLRVEKRMPECWDLAEIGRIIEAAAATPGHVAGIPAGHFWRALLLTAYDTGLRISALLKVERSNLNESQGWLRVNASTQKHKADQVFKLHPDTLAAVLKIAGPEGPIFPWPYDPKRRVWRSLVRHYRQILKRAGLPSGKRDLFHKIRRTTATYLADQAGAPTAQAYLGHSCLSVTLAYIDPTKVRAIRATEIMPRPFQAPAAAARVARVE